MVNDEFGEAPQYFFVFSIRIGRIKEDFTGFFLPPQYFSQKSYKILFYPTYPNSNYSVRNDFTGFATAAFIA